MKKIVLTGLLMLAAISVKAQQETVFAQDFEDIESVEEQQWGAIDADDDGTIFGLIQTQPVLVQLGFTGNVMGSSNFTLDDENNPVATEGSDNMLVSPLITLPEEDNLNLSFRLCGAGSTPEAQSHYSVYVVNALEFESVETIADFVAIIDTKTPIGEDSVNGFSFEVSYDISDHQGETAMVFVRHSESTGATFLFVDDFTITSGVMATAPALAASFNVYPNPTADFIRIENNNGIALQNITVTDANGKTVKTVACNGEQNATVALDNLSAGSYFVHIATDRGNIMKQVIRK